MEILLLYNREYTSRRGLCSSFGSKSNFLENLKCVRADQHLIEGSEGDIVPPLACSFNTVTTNLIAVADEDGGVLIIDTQVPGLQSLKQEWRAHKNAVFDVEWVPGENRLLTASGDQSAQLWDVETETAISAFKGHASSIKTISCGQDPHMFATGARDGHVMVWDARVETKNGYIPAINTIQNAHTIQTPDSSSSSTKKKRRPTTKNQQQQNSQQTVTAVVFQDEHTLATAGSVDGSVKLWDLRKNYSILKSEARAVHKFPYAGNSLRSHGFSSLVLDSTKTRLFANCMDNTVYMYDCAGFNTKPVASYRGHNNSTFYVKLSLSPDDVFLLSGSTDKNAYIWRVDEPQRSPLVLKGHNDEVSAVAWSPIDYTTLVTLSDDCTVCTWRAIPKDQPTPTESGSSHFVGTAEWTHRDIGVGATGAASVTMSPCLSSVILTPSRRLPSHRLTSPAPSPQTTPNKTTWPKVTGVTPKMERPSPVIPSVSRRTLRTPGSPRVQQSPCATSLNCGSSTPSKTISSLLKSPLKSPRQIHVLLSPRKTPIPGCFDALSPRKTLQQTASPRPQLTSPHSAHLARSVKRKLCTENEAEPSPRKRLRSDTALSMNGVAPLGTPNRPLAPSENITPAKAMTEAAQQRLNFNDPEKIMQSPTLNLPNYVLNPEPRTPQPAKKDELSKENCRQNWLVELRQRKDAEKGPDSGEVMPTPSPLAKGHRKASTPQIGASNSTPRSSMKKTGRNTPKASKLRTPTTRRSILSYFSPKDESKKN